ncbi:PA2169 family four-helix-bundle protein [Lysobacter sp. Hz 25]|uniref:PA2169 family four-helix-bundle protein n=1 Tax=Lysobacter sp. Hz 25 TaxID=3383698 RepID=UPI0038D4DD97
MSDRATKHNLNDLIEIARDGKEFYSEAAGTVKNAELSALFLRIASGKSDIVNALSAQVAASGGRPAEHGTFVGSMQQLYGKIRAAFGDTEYGYVAELEESEDRLLKAFNDAIGDAELPPGARSAVERLLPAVRDTHREMSQLKKSMKRST